MSKMNVMKKIQEMRGKINIYYDMDIEDIRTLLDSTHNRFMLVSNAFVFGYMQGTKAQKAKEKKGSK